MYAFPKDEHLRYKMWGYSGEQMWHRTTIWWWLTWKSNSRLTGEASNHYTTTHVTYKVTQLAANNVKEMYGLKLKNRFHLFEPQDDVEKEWMPVVAGTLSPDGQLKLKEWRSQMTPCSNGRMNDTTTLVLRDTGYKPVWLNRHWLSLSRWQDPMSYVCLLTELTRGIRQQLWTLTPHIILAWQKCCAWTHQCRHNCWQYTRCSWPRHRHKTTTCQIYITVYCRYITERRQSGETILETDKTPENKEDKSKLKNALQYKLLEQWLLTKVSRQNHSVPGWDVGPDEIKAKQKEDDCLRKYWTW